ncbi:MAG: hypothetical protein Q4F67_08620 [Propionibacteriaceae bacterium]|nr:hypothetical protein [Propionibacteriaceae bacterium]
MKRLSAQEIAHLRDSQVNIVASLCVYTAVWALLQGLLRLTNVDMPLVQIFDRHGNFSVPGITIMFLLLASALLPHWILLRRAGLTWREGHRLISDYRRGLIENPDGDVRRIERPAVDPVVAADSEYWQRRWAEFLAARAEDDREPG